MIHLIKFVVKGVLGPFIEVHGDWMPRKFLGRFHALFAILRMLYLAFVIVLFYRATADIVFLDGVSAPLIILKKLGGLKVLFYCHFPDLVSTLMQQFSHHMIMRIYIVAMYRSY